MALAWLKQNCVFLLVMKKATCSQIEFARKNKKATINY